MGDPGLDLWAAKHVIGTTDKLCMESEHSRAITYQTSLPDFAACVLLI